MTVFDEKVRALIYARAFLRELVLPNKLTKKQIRERARQIIRHWPFDTDVKIRDDNNKWQRLSDTSTSMEKDE